MPMKLHQLPVLFFFLVAEIFHLSHADIGIAARYGPPYLPTECSGRDASQFPSTNFFAAAGEITWNNGATCGREYLVRCLKAAPPGACTAGQRPIRVRIVDHAATAVAKPSRANSALALSSAAFAAIATGNPAFVNVEYIPN